MCMDGPSYCLLTPQVLSSTLDKMVALQGFLLTPLGTIFSSHALISDVLSSVFPRLPLLPGQVSRSSLQLSFQCLTSGLAQLSSVPLAPGAEPA